MLDVDKVREVFKQTVHLWEEYFLLSDGCSYVSGACINYYVDHVYCNNDGWYVEYNNGTNDGLTEFIPSELDMTDLEAVTKYLDGRIKHHEALKQLEQEKLEKEQKEKLERYERKELDRLKAKYDGGDK